MDKKSTAKKLVIAAVVLPVVATIGYFGLIDYHYADQANQMHQDTRLSQHTHQEMKRKFMADAKWAKVNDRLVLKEDANNWDDSTSAVDVESFPTSYLPGFQKFKAETYESAERYRVENKEQTFPRMVARKEAQRLCEALSTPTGADTVGHSDDLHQFVSVLSADARNYNLPLYAEYCGKNAAEVKALVDAATADNEAKIIQMERIRQEAERVGITLEQYVEVQAKKNGMTVEQYLKHVPGSKSVAEGPVG